SEPFVSPRVPRHRVGVPPVLGECQDPVVSSGETEAAEIHVERLDVAGPLVVPATRVVDRARRIAGLDQTGYPGSVELPPSLVERHPHRYRGAIVQVGDHRQKLGFEMSTPGAFATPETSPAPLV